MNSAQRAWCERQLGTPRYKSGGPRRLRGRVVDYKPDITGKGCYLIVEAGSGEDDTYEEWVPFPRSTGA